MSKFQHLPTDRLLRSLGMAAERRDELVEARRKNPTPNVVRAQELSEITSEMGLYATELRRREVEA